MDNTLFYLDNPIGRGYRFIKENNVRVFEETEILSNLLNLMPKEVHEIFQGRDIKWYKEVYSLFGKVCNEFPLLYSKEWAIVYTSKDCLVYADRARFNDECLPLEQYEEVHESVYESSTSSKSAARVFLEALGVKAFTENDLKAQAAEKSQEKLQAKIDNLTEKDDIFTITREIIQYSLSTNNRYSPLNLKGAWLLSETDKLVKAIDCFLDEPYLSTGFSKAKHIHNKVVISKIYKERLKEEELEFFVSLLKENGILWEFKIISVDIEENQKKHLLDEGSSKRGQLVYRQGIGQFQI